MAIPPPQVAKSKSLGDGLISLTVDKVSELLLGKQNTPDNVTVLLFHLLADCFYKSLYLLQPQMAF